MARLFVTVASFVAACATVNAFQVPRMSLDKYRSELAETAKKIAAPGTFGGGLDGGGGGVGWKDQGSIGTTQGVRALACPARIGRLTELFDTL